MIVATAKPDDLPALLELEESGFDAPERWSTGSWASELSSPDRLVLISRDEDQVEAVACFGVLDDTAEVLRVVVRPDRRERGIARRLVGLGMDWADAAGADRILLEVRYDNDRGLSLYKAAGFTAIARRSDYYGLGRHAIVMECRFHRRPAPGLSRLSRWPA